MRFSERLTLSRLKDAINAIPFPIAGGATQSSAFTGFINYQSDMRVFIPAMSRVLEGLICHGRSDMEVGIDYYNPHDSMDAIEAWIEKRKAAGWQEPVPPIEWDRQEG